MDVVRRSRSSEIPLFISPPDHCVPPTPSSARARAIICRIFARALAEVRARRGGSRGSSRRVYVWRPLRPGPQPFVSRRVAGNVASARARRVFSITASVRPPSRFRCQERTRSARMTASGRATCSWEATGGGFHSTITYRHDLAVSRRDRSGPSRNRHGVQHDQLSQSSARRHCRP